MSGRGLIILVAGLFVIGGTLYTTIFQRSETLTTNVVNSYNVEQAKNIANSAANLALSQLKNNSSWRTGYTAVQMGSGYYWVTLKDTVFNGSVCIRVIATGKTNYRTSTEVAYSCTAYVSSGFIPPAVKAAISTNNNIETLGTLTVDGRDHDLNGNLVSNNGTFGIWTTKNFNQRGSSKVGGTFSSTDYSPSRPGSSNVIRTSQTYPGGYPGSPDSALGGPSMGFAEGTLKSMAMSGTNGGQYVTNPALLRYPLSGVTYVELPSGGSWSPANIEGTGILIVHNTAQNAVIRNINFGTFKGLLMADDIDKIHNTIIGAVIGLSPTPPSGNCIGNGSGTVLYSSQVLTSTTATVSGTGGSSNVLAWKE
ncbi:MAG: hypothetical protein HUU43_09985 [Ignavibacteriaceae bacterium]|nr:hypothetical protein [Ignavibacteriaceae bacterium]